MQTDPRGGVSAPLLTLTDITKRFGDLVANDHISLDVLPGEVHALLGENGAGKTTLMNILYGLYRQDGGRIELRGRQVEIHSPRQAIQLRIGMVHQHFMLVPNFTVVENVILGLPVEKAPYLDLRLAAHKVAELADRYGMQVDPHALVGDLPVGVQQRVEILKTLYRGAELLILDEPTAVLTPLEVHEFFVVLKNLVQQGLSVIFISHKLNEVLEVSDRITVLRRGVKVGTLRTSEATVHRLAEMMVGREVTFDAVRSQVTPGAVTLETQQISAQNNQGRPVLKDISLQVRAGEVLGIAGVDGNGQQELAETLTGLRPCRKGKILVRGRDLTHGTPADFISSGVSFIPADRHEVGLVLDFSIAGNLVIKRMGDPTLVRWGVLNQTAIRSASRRAMTDYDIRAGSEIAITRGLSGGNQQKIILAREIESSPAILVAMHPTRGLDIGAMEYVQTKLLEQRSRGVAILLISTELEELLALSDRIAVMFRGEIIGEVPGESSSLDQIARMMLGERLDGVAA